MRQLLLATTMTLVSSLSVAGEIITLTGASSYLQVFKPKSMNLESQRMAEAVSFSRAVRKVSLRCHGDDYKILRERVKNTSRGGVAKVETILTIDCENLLPKIDFER